MWGYRWARELGVKVNGNLETDPSAWIVHYAAKKANQTRLFRVRHGVGGVGPALAA